MFVTLNYFYSFTLMDFQSQTFLNILQMYLLCPDSAIGTFVSDASELKHLSKWPSGSHQPPPAFSVLPHRITFDAHRVARPLLSVGRSTKSTQPSEGHLWISLPRLILG